MSSTHAALHYESVIDSGKYDTEIDLTPQVVNAARLGGITTRIAGFDFGYQEQSARQAQKEKGSFGFGGRRGESFLNLKPHRMGYLNTRTRAFQTTGGVPVFHKPNITAERKIIGIGGDDPSLWSLNVGTTIDVGSIVEDGKNAISYNVRLSGGQVEPTFVVDDWQSWLATNSPRDRDEDISFGSLMALDLNDIAGINVDNVRKNRFADDFTWAVETSLLNAGNKPLAHIGAGQVFVPGRGGTVDIVKRIWRDDAGQWWFFMGANVAQMKRNLFYGKLVIDPPISEESIAANADDAMQNGAAMLLSGYAGNVIYLGGNASYHGGWIFQSVPIGNGDTVNSATLEPYQVSATGTNVTATLYGIEENDAPAFVTTNNDITGRTRTAASTALVTANWPGNNTRATNWDVAGQVQEIINNPFWATLERIGFVGIGTNTNYQYVGFRDYNGSAVNAADFNADVSSGADPDTSQLPLGTVAIASFAPNFVTFDPNVSQLQSDTVVISPFAPDFVTFDSNISQLQSDIITVSPFAPDFITFDFNISQLQSGAVIITPFAPDFITFDSNISQLQSGAVIISPFAPDFVTFDPNTSQLPLNSMVVATFTPLFDSGDPNTSQLPSNPITIATFVPTVIATERNITELPVGTIFVSPFDPIFIATGALPDPNISQLDFSALNLATFNPRIEVTPLSARKFFIT